MPLKLNERNIGNKHNRLKNPNRREPYQLAIYKDEQGVELGSTEKQGSGLDRAPGLEPVTTGFQVWHPNHSANLPPQIDDMCRF